MRTSQKRRAAIERESPSRLELSVCVTVRWLYDSKCILEWRKSVILARKDGKTLSPNEGMAAICGGVVPGDDAGHPAATTCAKRRGSGNPPAASDAAQIAQDRGVQPAAGVSRLDRRAAPWGAAQDDAQSGVDGRGIRAIPEVHARKHRAGHSFGWTRKFSCGAEARQRGDLPYGPHRRLGTFLVCAWAVWFPAALHGAAAGQRAAGPPGEPLPRAFREPADLQERIGARDAKGAEGSGHDRNPCGPKHHAGGRGVRGFFRHAGMHDDRDRARGPAYGCRGTSANSHPSMRSRAPPRHPYAGPRARSRSSCMALHTDAAVVPGYAYWDENLRKYRLRFEPPVELVRTGDAERDAMENTRRFTKVIEEIIRQHPEQWVWVHARWKNRPPGEPPLYDFL